MIIVILLFNFFFFFFFSHRISSMGRGEENEMKFYFIFVRLLCDIVFLKEKGEGGEGGGIFIFANNATSNM